jgi:hypothetical protein
VELPPTTSRAKVKERIELYIYTLLELRGMFQGKLYLYLHTHNQEIMSQSGNMELETHMGQQIMTEVVQGRHPDWVADK